MFYKNILDYTTGQSEIWFMADLHLNHSNILKHSERPYLKVSEMNKDFIDQLHRVKENDYLFDLGDLFWKTDPSQIENIIKNNIKTKHFWKILGNHDKESIYRDNLSKYFEGVSESLDLSIKIPESQVGDESKVITLSLDHYPKVSWNNKPRGSLMLHGHTHGNIDEYNEKSTDLRVDVGFDGKLADGKILVPLSKIINYFNQKTDGQRWSVWAKGKCKNL